MSKQKLTCYRIDCAYQDASCDKCELDHVVIGSSGLCCTIKSKEDQDQAEQPAQDENPED